MRAHHKQAITADFGHRATALRARVHGHMFANFIARADFQRHIFIAEFQILLHMANRSERINMGFIANAGIAGHRDMAFQHHAIAELHIARHHAIRPDAYIGAQLHRLINNRSWMYIPHELVLRRVEKRSK